MAQAKPFSWYGGYAVGFPGMKANVTGDVCDSFAVEGGVNAGDAVIRGTNPATQTKRAEAGGDANVIGIAVHTHRDPQNGSEFYYEDGYSVSVMTFGDIYVKASGDVTAGQGVAINGVGADGVMTFKAASTGGIAGMTFMDSGVEGDIVRVRIRK